MLATRLSAQATSHAYTLDSEGNRTALSEFVSGITTGASDSFGFSYDGLERLTAVTTTNAESFTLDAASNITARTGPSKTFTIDGSNRPTSDGANTLTWSAADRLTGRGSDSFGFDPLDRLTSSTVSGTSRTYAYNGDGLLQSRTAGGSTVSLLWDPATSPSRLLVSGSDKIVYGLGPLYSVNGSTVTTYARDGQKSIRAELNGTSVTSSWRYRAYGETAQSSGAATPSILGYAGQLLDPSGLYYLRARWYDAATGRLMTHDPLSGGPQTPSSLNAYAYGRANPLMSADPSGLRATIGDGTDGGGCLTVSSCVSSSSGNWAYAVAQIFADMDSPDSATRTAAYAKVGVAGLAAGVASAGAVAASVAVAGAAAAATATTATVTEATAAAATAAPVVIKISHVVISHFEGDAAAAEEAATYIAEDVNRLLSTGALGNAFGWVNTGSQWVQYRVFDVGTHYNVGTFFPVGGLFGQ